LDGLASYESVALYVERAREVQANFVLTEDNASAVAEICRRLDGLPLAIELAAARTKLLPPQAMLGRLDRRLPLLTGGARDLPARHQTLRAAIAWSYDLLDRGEQTLFRRLAIFVGGCALDAAEAIVGEELPLSCLDGMGSLIDKSLLRQEEQRDGEPRFLMLETVREYGLEQLAAAGEVEMLRRRHAHFFAGLAEQQVASGANPDASWLNRMEREHPNLRLAMDWLIGIGDAPTALRMGHGMWHFWRLHNHYAEGQATVERALTLPGVPDIDVRTRAGALATLGVMASNQGKLAPARAAWEQALDLYQRAGDEPGTAQALIHLAMIHLGMKETAATRELAERSLLSFRATGNPIAVARGAAFAHDLYGRAALLEGDLHVARAHFEEGLALARTAADRNRMVFIGASLADVALQEGQVAEARSQSAESLRLAAELGNRRAIAVRFEHLAGILALEDRPREALCLVAAAHRLREEVGAGGEALDDESRLQQLMQDAEQALGAAASAAALAEGRELTIEQAMSIALGTAT
jgi:tetratricopeptide (TPR) repeat protein